MRQVTLDTETTGLYPAEGDRIISIGCVEIVDRKITGREWHTRLNPEGRPSHPGALAVHKIPDADLVKEPTFSEAKFGFWNFLKGANEIIIHNAPFDIGFINAEIARQGSSLKFDGLFNIVDTMRMGGVNVGGSLNRLLDKYEIDRTIRNERHGALIDARLLAQLYLAMTRGQEKIDLPTEEKIDPSEAFVTARPEIPVVLATPEELAAHEAMMANIRRTA